MIYMRMELSLDILTQQENDCSKEYFVPEFGLIWGKCGLGKTEKGTKLILTLTEIINRDTKYLRKEKEYPPAASLV